MTTPHIGPLVPPTIVLAMMGWLSQGCGRTSLLVPGAQASRATDAGAATVTSGATSQPMINGACPGGFTACGRGGATRCYDLSRAPDHCGQCDNACAPGIACRSSKCQQYQCKGALSFKALPEISTMLPGDPASETFRTSYSSYRPVLGDFDGDGSLDFVGLPGVMAPMGLLLGKGDGTFQAHPIASAFVASWMAAAADLNGDGRLDLVAVAGDQAAVSVRLANGDPVGLFEPATVYPTSNPPDSLVLGDFDADGHVDFVGADYSAATGKQLRLWRGAGDGTFSESGHVPVRDSGAFLVAVDWNRDGALDLLYGSSILRMVLGRGNGTFEDETACGIALGIGLSSNAVADFDQDQKLDLAVRSTGIFLGMNGCNFTTLVPVPDSWSASSESLGVADLNGDGHLDLVTNASDSTFEITVYLGDGHGGFTAPLTFPSVESQTGGAYLMGDLNNDTKLDLIITRSDGWRVLLNTCP